MIWMALVIALSAAVPAAAQEAERLRGVVAGDPERGRKFIAEYACGVCHTIPGIRGARGSVGPDLTRFGSRNLIAGIIPNRPDLLALWVHSPQAIAPGTGMPDVGVTHKQARDIAAYLATLDGDGASLWSGTIGLARSLLRGPE